MSKVYLCVDLRFEGKIKTCYLLHEDFEALLKFTSFCDNERMLISTLPVDEINVPEYISKNIDGNRFYFKKHKNSEPFNILYKNDDDVLYADYKEIISIIKKENLYVGDNQEITTYEEKEFYEKIASLINDKTITAAINANFYSKYNSDRNIEYLEYQDYPLYKKIAMVSENINVALKYICSNIVLKYEFLLEFKYQVGKRLVSDEKYSFNKGLLYKSLKRKKLDFNHLSKEISKNIMSFYGIKKEEEKRISNGAKEKYYPDSDELEIIEDEVDYISYYKQKLEKESKEPDFDPDSVIDLINYVDYMNDPFVKK